MITLTQRSNDWHACIEGMPSMWACGKDEEAAVASLARFWPLELLDRYRAEVERLRGELAAAKERERTGVETGEYAAKQATARAEAAEAHAAELRAALETYADGGQWGLTHDNAKHCDWFLGIGLPADKRDGWAVAVDALARTPAQSLASLTAQVLEAAALVFLAEHPEAAAKLRAEAKQMELEATNANEG